MTLQGWPALLHSLVHEFGAAKVWEAALQHLGFPGDWITSHEEVKKLRTFIELPF